MEKHLARKITTVCVCVCVRVCVCGRGCTPYITDPAST